MKERILSLLMAVVMVFGMGVMSHAEEDDIKHYQGIIEWIFPSTEYGTGEAEEIEIYATFDGDIFEFKFEDGEGNYIEWKGKYWLSDKYVHILEMTINGEKVNTGAGVLFNSDFTTAETVSRGFAADGTSFCFNAKFILSLEAAIHEISTPFTGTAVSDRKEYTLALAGYFEKDLTDGTHELTLGEINAQTISIVAYNRANGVKRVMTQSTIEEMSVTVSGGVVTEYTIGGRVQTTGGKLDRYTAVIEQ